MDKADSSCGRKRRAENDSLFSRGNRIAFEHSGAIFYIEQQQHNDANDEHAVGMNVNDKKTNGESIIPLRSYPCCVFGCTQTFQTILECESHFDEQHLFQCGECHQVLSSNHLLELHLQEAHDSYFAASIEKQQASYACLVESCKESFSSPDGRLQHLRNEHGYPKWFRFTTLITREEREMLKKKQTWAHNHHKHSLPPTSQDQDGNMQVDNTTRDAKKAKRREKQKQRRATIPCRYFLSKEGCWRGDSCVFLHEKVKDVEMVDGLVNDMQQKAKVTVPDKISFGRRRRGGGPY